MEINCYHCGGVSIDFGYSKEGYSELYEEIVQLKLEAADGKKYETDCSNTEGIFRIVQSIPSPKAEPFKRWLAKVGYEIPISNTRHCERSVAIQGMDCFGSITKLAMTGDGLPHASTRSQ